MFMHRCPLAVNRSPWSTKCARIGSHEHALRRYISPNDLPNYARLSINLTSRVTERLYLWIECRCASLTITFYEVSLRCQKYHGWNCKTR
jgi:hypothetical protein